MCQNDHTLSLTSFLGSSIVRLGTLVRTYRSMSEFMDGNDAHSEAQCSTYWGECSFGESNGFPWTLRLHPTGGHIAIANRPFKAGELICIERPTTWTKAWHPFTAEQKSAIEAEISDLSPGMLHFTTVCMIHRCLSRTDCVLHFGKYDLQRKKMLSML